MKPSLYVGMMSGTSADGIDVAIVEFDGTGDYNVIGTHFQSYPNEIKIEVNRLALSDSNLCKLDYLPLDTKLAQLYSDAVLTTLKHHNINANGIAAIANHGQTIRHTPNATPPSSLQIGNPQTIANLTGIRTISQFRQGDLEAGGQGAPLMPAFHNHYYRKDATERAVINIGGIANITIIPGSAEAPVIGYDTGPGNTLMDQWIRKELGKSYDKNGELAASAKPKQKLLSLLYDDHYFRQSHPKSTGPDYFNLRWLSQAAPQLDHYDVAQVLSTLLELTVVSIVDSIGDNINEVYLCGGGAANKELVRRLKHHCPQTAVSATDTLGLPADWVEAVGFAWLGYCFDSKIASNLPSVTGANKHIVLGEQFVPN